MNFVLILVLGLLLPLPAFSADPALPTEPAPDKPIIATYPEIPYYLRQLNETDVERRRVELNKILHDAVVNADLSDKRTVGAMEPMIAKIRIAMDSGLDRAYLEGSSMWLGSAVDYFDREKLRLTVEIPETDWTASQAVTSDGGQLNITPEKVWLIHGEKSALVAESSNIHEAVITRDGRRAVFSRQLNDGTRSEIWTVNMKNRVRKKIATVASCYTLLISESGNRVFFQETPSDSNNESAVWSLGISGGTPKKLGDARLLQTVVGKGRHQGAVIVYKNRLHHLGTTSKECAYAWNESGGEIGRLKNVPCR